MDPDGSVCETGTSQVVTEKGRGKRRGFVTYFVVIETTYSEITICSFENCLHHFPQAYPGKHLVCHISNICILVGIEPLKGLEELFFFEPAGCY